jgi:CheY-like chemotaxis protein
MTHPRRILVADDEPTIRFLLDKILTDEGYHVTTVSNGEEALRMSATHVFELFLIDLIMPGKDGIETILTLRAKRKHTPILAISGGWNDGANSCLPLAGKLGACGTLAKPFDRATLLDAVRRELAK